MALNSNISAYLKRFREEHHLTYDQIADAARQYGARWVSATILSMEHGARMADSLSNMLILASSLNDLLEKDGQPRSVTLLDLIEPTEDQTFYDLGRPQDDADADFESVREALSGQPVTLTTKLFGFDISIKRERPIQVGEPHFEYRADEEGYISRGDIVSNHMPTIAEKRAAERLDIQPYDVAAFCAVRYGGTLEDESYRRAGQESTPQKRGRVTRTIVNEIRETLEALELQARKQGTAELTPQER